MNPPKKNNGILYLQVPANTFFQIITVVLYTSSWVRGLDIVHVVQSPINY